MQVRRAAFVVVEMHVSQPRAVRLQNFVSRVPFHEQIRVAYVEMEAEFGNGIQQLRKLLHAVEASRQVLNHQTDPAFAIHCASVRISCPGWFMVPISMASSG